ncbi:uncharacterized protein LOC141641517 [Silene latifolia]|uniref:uncharacterized protein LOC141641517 n=1 Tax=Silene latifolia TaxID=37657 RepID=UPI003D781C0C
MTQGQVIIQSEKPEHNDKKTEFIPPSSPLYLHPSESTTQSLSQITFDGDNYQLWADAVRNALDAKNKLSFIEGTVKKPVVVEGEAETLEAVAWRQCNAMVKAWLRNSIHPKLHPSIAFSETVMEIWKELRDRYSAGNAPRVHQLKSDLNECKQKKNQSVVEYYTQLKAIWDELGNYSKIPRCTCGAAATMLKECEEAKVRQFLMGLDNTLYGQIRSNLLIEDEVPPLIRAYALVLREERHHAVTKEKEVSVEAAMSVQVAEGSSHDGNVRFDSVKDGEYIKVIRCTHCKKLWHAEDKYWEKHGRGRGRGNRGGRGRGSRGRGNQANAATVTEEDNFTPDEVTQLRSFLNKGDNSKQNSGPIYEDEYWEG